MDALEVGEVSRRTGVTVRTLHHYDQIGLLVPQDRSHAGYRRYSQADLERLRRILFYRELDFPLDRIAALLADPESPQQELRRQRALVEQRIERLQRMARAIDHELEAGQMGISLTPDEKFELFGPDWSDHEVEAEQRWGDTEEWRESQRRTATYGPAQWRQLKVDGEEIEQGFVRLQAAGEPATGAAAVELAETYRQYMTTWFYEVTPHLHRCLGQLYVGDARFAAHYDELAPGLSGYVSEAIIANADRLEAAQ